MTATKYIHLHTCRDFKKKNEKKMDQMMRVADKTRKHVHKFFSFLNKQKKKRKTTR